MDRVSDPFRTLVLLRHGKSAYPPDCADRDRPLAERGIREAGLAGDWLRPHVPPVDAVLCSPATRTRQTFDRTRLTAPVHYAERLYDATPGTVIDVINGVAAHFDTDIRTLLVIGHEPALSRVALGLSDGGNATAAQRISEKFPTSAIAVLRTAADWDELALQGAALVAFHVPR